MSAAPVTASLAGGPKETSCVLGLRIAYPARSWLNSTVVDDYFRIFSGHTQVNATDLRKLRYPDAVTLKTLGDAGGNLRITQAETDAIVDEAVR